MVCPYWLNSVISPGFMRIFLYFSLLALANLVIKWLMRLLDRLYQYLEHQNISAYAFEHACDLSNGYLGKQKRGKGTMGSEVLLKIQACFPDLNIHWLLTGKGRMLRHAFPYSTEEDPELEIVQLLQERIVLLEKSLKDKNELIHLLKKKRPDKNRSALSI